MKSTSPLIVLSLIFLNLASAKATDAVFWIPANSAQSPFVSEITQSKYLIENNIHIELRQTENEHEIVDALLNERADFGLVTFDTIASHKFSNPPTLASIFIKPFLLDSLQDRFDIQQSALGKAILADLNRTSLIPIEYWNKGEENLIAKFPVTTPADFASLRLGSSPNTSVSALSKLAVSETSMAAGDLFSALAENKVNGTITQNVSPSAVQNSGAKYVTLVRPIVGVFLASPRYWRTLSEREKLAWRYTADGAAKHSDGAAEARTRNVETVATLTTWKIGPTQKAEILKQLFPNDPSINDQVNLVQEVLTSATAQRVKKKTESRPLIIPKPSPFFFATDRSMDGDGSDFYNRFGSNRNENWTPVCGKVDPGMDLSRNFGSEYYGNISLTEHGIVNGFTSCSNLIAPSIGNDARLLIFVHGYNHSLHDALRRGAGMAYDYYFDGAIVVWSWPSDGLSQSYFFDEDSSKWTAPHLADFIRSIHKASPKTHLIVFSHSMGARVVLAALQEVRDTSIAIDSVVFAAPDEARDIFGQSLERLNIKARNMTLYGSENDVALTVSRYAHSPSGRRIARAGDGGREILILDGLDSIDTSELISPNRFGHSYVFDTPEATADVKRVITEGLPASRRSLRERLIFNRKYWALTP